MDASLEIWEENSNMQNVKFESNLNFAAMTCCEDESEFDSFNNRKGKISRQDPMSHRIIEKRRRDRMNNCLADLSRLIPADYLKKGRGRIEKTEIIEMAIKYMKCLQQSPHRQQQTPVNADHYRLGFQECLSETMRFLVEVEGFFAREALCIKLINHLQRHCESILTSDRLQAATATNGTGQATQTHLEQPYDNPSQLKDMLNNPNRTPMTNSNVPQDLPQNLDPCEDVKHNLYSPSAQTDLYEYHEEMETEHRNLKKSNHVRRISETESNNSTARECTNGASLYKFKNNIMQRINQESISETNSHISLNYKRKKTHHNENYTENSQNSPQSSDAFTRISSESDTGNRISPSGSSFTKYIKSCPQSQYQESETSNRISPTGSSVSDIKNCVKTCVQSQYEQYTQNKNKSLSNTFHQQKNNFGVPIFALHSKGSFYIPLTIDYNTLLPYLQSYNIIDVSPSVGNLILHPVTINVNFQPMICNGLNNNNNNNKQKYKVEENGWH